MAPLLVEIIPSCLELCVNYDWRAMALKIVPKDAIHSRSDTLLVSHTTIVGIPGVARIVRPHVPQKRLV